jgi:hypothetical protein
MSMCVKYEADALTALQSMNGLPWWGVEMVVSESGAYSSGRTSLIRYRRSSPPIECAIRFTPRPHTREEGEVELLRARSKKDALLLTRHSAREK